MHAPDDADALCQSGPKRNCRRPPRQPASASSGGIKDIRGRRPQQRGRLRGGRLHGGEGNHGRSRLHRLLVLDQALVADLHPQRVEEDDRIGRCRDRGLRRKRGHDRRGKPGDQGNRICWFIYLRNYWLPRVNVRLRIYGPPHCASGLRPAPRPSPGRVWHECQTLEKGRGRRFIKRSRKAPGATRSASEHGEDA